VGMGTRQDGEAGVLIFFFFAAAVGQRRRGSLASAKPPSLSCPGGGTIRETCSRRRSTAAHSRADQVRGRSSFRGLARSGADHPFCSIPSLTRKNPSLWRLRRRFLSHPSYPFS